MSFTTDPRRIRGALDFLAELEAVALECAQTGVWDDELTIRRRQREDIRPGLPLPSEAQVKAL